MTSSGEISAPVSEGTPGSLAGTVTFAPTGSSEGTNERRNTIVATAVALLVLLFAFWPGFEGGAGLMDEGMILVYPEMIQQGKLPYRDFETFYGPANPALLAAVFSTLGTNIFVERAVGLVYRMLILLAVFAIVRNWGRVLAVGCLFLTGCLLLGTQLPAYSWWGAMACVLWSLWLCRRTESDAHCFFGGLLAGAALLFRVDVGPAILISALPLFHGMARSRKWKYISGAAVALFPLGLLTLVVGLQPVADNLFLTPVIHSSPARHLPLALASPSLRILFYCHLIAAGVNVAAGISAMCSKSRDVHARLLLGVALLGLGLSHQAAQRLDFVHLIFASFISLGILPLSLVVIVSRLRNAAPKTSEMVLAFVAVVAVFQAIAPELLGVVRKAFAAGFHSTAAATFVEHKGRSFPFRSPRQAQDVGMLLDRLDRLSASGERLFVGPGDLRRTNYNDTYIYHLMPKLAPATYFLEMNPLSANRPRSRLAADVESADWLVLNRSWDSWREANRSSEYGSNEPNAVIERDFEICGEFGGYLLFRRKKPDLPGA